MSTAQSIEDVRLWLKARACAPELLECLRTIRSLTYRVEQPQEARLDDIFALANEFIEKIECR